MVVRQGGGVMEEGLYGGWKGGDGCGKVWKWLELMEEAAAKVGIRVMEATA